jgi:hypothetical protein
MGIKEEMSDIDHGTFVELSGIVIASAYNATNMTNEHMRSIKQSDIEKYIKTVSAILGQYKDNNITNKSQEKSDLLRIVGGFKIKYWQAEDNPNAKNVFINDNNGKKVGRIWRGNYIAEIGCENVPEHVIKEAKKLYAEQSSA